MKSVVRLFKNCKVVPDKNFVLDQTYTDIYGSSIQVYLQLGGHLDSLRIDAFQYVKHSLSLSIKIKLDQTNLEMISTNDYNYVSIRNYSEIEDVRTYEKYHYYFVINKKWLSTDTIEFVLSMDTLNTFLFGVDYSISKKSLIRREHRNRIHWLGQQTRNISFTPGGGSSWVYEYTDLLIGSYVDIPISGIIIDEISAVLPGGTSASVTLDSYTISQTERGTPCIKFEGTHTPTSTISITFKYSVKAFSRDIDMFSEDILPPLYKTTDTEVYDEFNVSWYLLYKNKDNPEEHPDSPVECYLLPDQSLKIRVPASTGVITTSMIDSGKYMIIFAHYNDPEISLYFNGSYYSPEERNSYNVKVLRPIAIKNNAGTLELYTGNFNNYTGNIGAWTKIDDAVGTIYLENSPDVLRCRIENSLPDANTIYNTTMYASSNATNNVSMTSDSYTLVNAVNNIDRTDPRNIKLIKLPYAPTNLQVDSTMQIILDDSIWAYDSSSKMIKLVDTNIKFVHNIKSYNVTGFVSKMIAHSQYMVLTKTANRQDLFESKLYHSDFYRYKFVYDSFIKFFPLEQISFTRVNEYLKDRDPSLSFNFVVSRNIVSKFLFEFDQFLTERSNEDYEKILYVGRNNEEVLYSSQYLNYLRTGYNYDIKTKQRNEVAGGVGIGLSIVSGIAGVVGGLASGNYAVAVGSAVASAISLSSQLVNYAKTTAQNEQNIAQKLQESQMNAVSVQNADDVDLLSYYANNKAKVIEYSPSVRMNQALADLFYYCGYRREIQGIPDIKTRYWFNFLQASLVFDDSANLPIEIENDIKEKFEQGVTFLHSRVSGGLVWDFDQVKENWEMEIVPYLN